MVRRTRATDPASTQSRPPPAPTHIRQRPDPEAWRLALDIADGDPSRVEVLDPRTLHVHNQPQ